MYVVRVDDVLLMSEMRPRRVSAAFLRGFGTSRFGDVVAFGFEVRGFAAPCS